MENEKKKAKKMCAEIISYFIEHRIYHMSVDINFTEELLSITVSGHSPVMPTDLDQLNVVLNEGRQPEMDEYYDCLLGSDSNNQGYFLLGAMVDHADIIYEGDMLHITLERKRSFKG